MKILALLHGSDVYHGVNSRETSIEEILRWIREVLKLFVRVRVFNR